jgi:hypothetical protein
VALLLLNNSSSIKSRRLSLASPWTMPRNCAMLKCISLYSSSSPVHSTCSRDVVL